MYYSILYPILLYSYTLAFFPSDIINNILIVNDRTGSTRKKSPDDGVFVN